MIIFQVSWEFHDRLNITTGGGDYYRKIFCFLLTNSEANYTVT